MALPIPMWHGRHLLPIALFLGLVACDHGTKLVAEHELEGRAPTVLIRDAVELAYHRNFGIAFNLERVVPEPARLPLYVVLNVAVMTVLAVAWWRRRRELSSRTVAYALIAAGAVGNLLDRVVRGYVVDFVHLRGWPVFNAADVFIVAGVGLLLLAALVRRGPPHRARA